MGRLREPLAGANSRASPISSGRKSTPQFPGTDVLSLSSPTATAPGTLTGSDRHRRLPDSRAVRLRSCTTPRFGCCSFRPAGRKCGSRPRRPTPRAAWWITAGPCPSSAVGLRRDVEGISELDWSPDERGSSTTRPRPAIRSHHGRRQDRRRPADLRRTARHSLPLPDLVARRKEHLFRYGWVPDEMDLWRIDVGGGTPERLTQHNLARQFSPCCSTSETLLYLATAAGRFRSPGSTP